VNSALAHHGILDKSYPLEARIRDEQVKVRIGTPTMMNLPAVGVSAIRITMPYAAGALGGTLSERGGVVNIALEGIMLGSAFAYATGSWWMARYLGASDAATVAVVAPLFGLGLAILTGFALSLLHAIACVTFKADNIISGLAINILSLGATNFLLKRIFGSASNSEQCPSFRSWQVLAPDSAWAVLNPLFHPLILLTLLAFVGAWFLLYRTRFGLRLRAVGENPAAADSLGVSVAFYRYCGVLLGGVAASLGGVWLASDQGLFSSGMTNGRGYTALAAMILGKWTPGGAAAACLIFGTAEAFQNQLQVLHQGSSAQATGWLAQLASGIPTQAIQALPYVLTILVLAGFVGRATPPAADGVPYEKESE
jgi:simple sugar transport system permease protein